MHTIYFCFRDSVGVIDSLPVNLLYPIVPSIQRVSVGSFLGWYEEQLVSVRLRACFLSGGLFDGCLEYSLLRSDFVLVSVVGAESVLVDFSLNEQPFNLFQDKVWHRHLSSLVAFRGEVHDRGQSVECMGFSVSRRGE